MAADVASVRAVYAPTSLTSRRWCCRRCRACPDASLNAGLRTRSARIFRGGRPLVNSAFVYTCAGDVPHSIENGPHSSNRSLGVSVRLHSRGSSLRAHGSSSGGGDENPRVGGGRGLRINNSRFVPGVVRPPPRRPTGTRPRPGTRQLARTRVRAQGAGSASDRPIDPPARSRKLGRRPAFKRPLSRRLSWGRARHHRLGRTTGLGRCARN